MPVERHGTGRRRRPGRTRVVARVVAQQLERVALVDAVALHEDALGALDHAAPFERALELLDLLVQPRRPRGGGGRRPRSPPGPTPGPSTRRRRRCRARPRARGSRRWRPGSWAITGPDAYSTASPISASACSSSWWTTTIATCGSSLDDQLDRLADRHRVRRHLVARARRAPRAARAAPPRPRRRSAPAGGSQRWNLRRCGHHERTTLVLLRPRDPSQPSRAPHPGASSTANGEGRGDDRSSGGARASGGAYPPGSDDRAARAREDRRLLERYHRHGDPAAREALVQRFLPLARQLARRYQRGGEPLDDLVQVASLGLLKAIDRFEPERPTAFSSFAVPTILGELKRHFRDKRLVGARPARPAGDGRPRRPRGRGRSRARSAARRRRSRSPSTSASRPSGARGARGRRRLPRGLARPPARRRARTATAWRTSMGIEDPGFGRAEHAATVERLMTRADRARARGAAPALRRGPHAVGDRRRASASRRCTSRA